jgi:glycosyltransferase involved in cell wall biosynthesis
MIAYTAYPTDGRVRLEAESLASWGYDVAVFALKGSKHPRTYSLRNVNVVELNVAKYRGKDKLRYLLSYVHFLVLAFFACTWAFFKSRAHVIHVHNMPDVLVFAALIPRIFGCKIVLDLHDTVPETYAGKFESSSSMLFNILSLEERICCWLAHRIICVNHVQREAVIARGISREKVCTVITMPIFSNVQQSDRAYREVFRVVNHGTISKRLGTDLLIRAAATLAAEIPAFELHIIGGGDDWDEMIDLAKRLGVAGQVKFRPGVPWDALPKVLGGMDVGVIANRANIATQLMLPAKLMDYVSLGIPAVLPKLRAVQYYFTPDMVTYFDPEDVDDMAKAVISLYRDIKRRREQAAQAKLFLTRYNWSEKTDLQDLYAGFFRLALHSLPAQEKELETVSTPK